MHDRPPLTRAAATPSGAGMPHPAAARCEASPQAGAAPIGRWLLWALACFALVALLQAWASPTVEMDQGEQVILSQRLQWGYTNQPPLYTWLVWLANRLGGPGVVQLAAVKVLALTGLVAGVLGAARELGFDAHRQRLALATLALTPALIWEAQRDLTHSLIAATLTALTLWAALAAVRRARLGGYALAGVLAGGALLGKHNAVVFLLGLALALLTLPAWRARLRPAGLLLALLGLLIVVAPHAAWLHAHPEVLALTRAKVGDAGGASPLQRLGHTLADVVMGGLTYLTPALWLALPMLWAGRRAAPACEAGAPAPGVVAGERASTPAGDGMSPLARPLTGRLLLSTLAMLVAFLLAAGAAQFKDRWLLPLLVFVPLWIAARAPARPGRATRVYGAAGLLLALVIAALLPARIVWPIGQAQTRQNAPLADLARRLAQQWGGVPPVVLASGHFVGGNLKLAWPRDTLVLTPAARWPVALPAEVMLVARREDFRNPRFDAWLRQRTGHGLADIRWGGVVEAPLLHRPQAAPMPLAWARVPVAPQAAAATPLAEDGDAGGGP